MTEYETLKKKIEKCKRQEIEEINKTEIDEVKNIKINQNISHESRMIEFLNKVNNPYIIRVGDTIVKIQYGNDDIKITNCIKKIVLDNSL